MWLINFPQTSTINYQSCAQNRNPRTETRKREREGRERFLSSMRQPGDNPRLDPRVNDLPYKDPVRATHVDSCSAWIMVFTFDPTDDNAFPRMNGVGWPGNSQGPFLYSSAIGTQERNRGDCEFQRVNTLFPDSRNVFCVSYTLISSLRAVGIGLRFWI